jgi:REP element-mobilizing transposase RayT
MARKPRIEYTGAFYHVITRGNQKQDIFKDAADYQKYLLLLASYKNRTACRIYAYALMRNHVHLLTEMRDIPLSKFMQGLNQTYTMYYNRRYRTIGHLFQGRYKAILCDKETYLLGLLKYIHQNPLRAKIAETLDDYPWSSHHAYRGKSNPLALVDTDAVLRMFSERKGRARQLYREFMSGRETIGKNAVYATVDQRIQGDEAFVEQVMLRSERPVESGKKKKAFSLMEIMTAVEHRTGITLEQMRSASKISTIMEGRRIFSLVAREYGHTGKEIAHYLGKDPAAVTGYCRKGNDHREEITGIIYKLEKERSQ